MMSKKSPQLRFEGFTDDWEERKLGDLATSFEYGLNASAKSFDGTHKYIRITDIDDSSRKFNSQSLTSPDIDLSSADNYKLKNGDILFARTGASVGKSYIYADSDGLVYYAGFLIRARIKSGVDSNFVFQHTLTSSYENFIRVTSQRSGQPGVNAKEYSTFEISVPSYEEQRKIGSFFKQLDDTITLHQRKIDLLKEQKKGYLQKMFPKNGAKVPELRFAGFADDWEERKVKDIFKITRGHVLAATETSEEKSDISPFPVYSSQTKNNGLMGYYKDYLFDTAITWTTDGANAGTVSYRSGRFYSTNVNGVLISDKGYTNKAISEILNLEAWKWVSHVGNPKLMNNVMGDISIMIPSSFEEQDRLSDFLNQLDDTIALHQRKLDLLKEQKKGFLQKMFV